jgi:hypothetical protein
LRAAHTQDAGKIIAIPILGRLHHRYMRMVV